MVAVETHKPRPLAPDPPHPAHLLPGVFGEPLDDVLELPVKTQTGESWSWGGGGGGALSHLLGELGVCQSPADTEVT